MLVFPERVLDGDVPNKDFLHLYGPGSLWFLAGIYKVFGTSLEAERLVGLLQQVGLVTGVFALARPWGRALATFGAVISLLIIVPPIGLVALAWVGAMALGIWAVWAALRARRSPPGAARWWALLSGVLAGLALLYRPDMVLAAGLGLAVALWGAGAARWRRFLVGLAVGLSPYLVQAATAGVETSFRGMVLDPVIYLRGGRRLPIPPSPDFLAGFLQRVGEFGLLDWPLPTLTTAEQNFVWFWLLLATVVALAGIGGWLLRRDPASFRARVLLAVALYSVGLLPQGIQRVDTTHFAWASAIPLGMLPVALVELLRRRSRPRRPLLGPVLAGSAVLLLLVALIPNYTVRRYADFSLQTFGRHRRFAHDITYNGRTFYYGRQDVAEAMEELLPAVEAVAPPGGRLFVGTHDLRFTPYSDAFLYYLLPDLEPATYYIEMDPGVANREDSGLAEDLASADVVVLSRVWYNWDEPNDTRDVGSEEPGRVLEERFCLVGLYGERQDRSNLRNPNPSPIGAEGAALYELYERCR